MRPLSAGTQYIQGPLHMGSVLKTRAKPARDWAVLVLSGRAVGLTDGGNGGRVCEGSLEGKCFRCVMML